MNDFTPSGPGVILVCSGGGIHGAAQAGMLAELFAAGFSCDAVVGVSAGACNAIEVAASPSTETAERLCTVWGDVDTSGMLPGSKRAQFVNLIANRSGESRQAMLRQLLGAALSITELAECQLPVHVGTVDVLTGETVWFSSGPALDVLCASAALPGVFPPVRIDDRDLYDGGVTDALPLRRAVELGARGIVALDVTKLADSSTITSHLKMLRRGVEHTREALRQAHIEAVPATTALAVIRAPHAGASSMTEEVAVGRAVMREWLDNHPLQSVAEPAATPLAKVRWWRRSATSASPQRSTHS